MKTPEELLNEVLDAVLTEGKDEAIKLIKQAKSEWCRSFLEYYCQKYEMPFTEDFKQFLIKEFLHYEPK